MNNIEPGCKALITGADDPSCRHLIGKECKVINRVSLPDEIELCKYFGLNPDNCWNIYVPDCPNDYVGSHEKFLLRIDGNEELFEKEDMERILEEDAELCHINCRCSVSPIIRRR